ncbi:MAG TPA: response regulator [Bacteroidales bacterium]|nr:response regulator [Bacteroidales bacterium]
MNDSLLTDAKNLELTEMRMMLDGEQEKTVTLQNEIEFLSYYMDLMSMRFKDKFSYSIIVDDNIDLQNFKIPSLLVQPYVENCTYHGLRNKQGKGSISIEFKMHNNHLHCNIEDNGIGRNAAIEMKQRSGAMSDKSYGTRISENRFQLLNSMYGKIHPLRHDEQNSDHMSMLNAIIIDDEPDSVKNLEKIIHEYCPNVNVIAKANSVGDALIEIENKHPGLVLLDIELQDGTGFDVLEKSRHRNFEVIFITAFNQYAIRAFKHSATDYILKPVDITELREAITRVSTNRSEKSVGNFSILLDNLKSESPRKLAIPTLQGYEYILVDNIIRIEAERSYCTIFLLDKLKIMVSRCMNDYQKILDERQFFRAHNSYLINLQHVKMYVKRDGGHIEMVDGSIVPLARRKKDFFMEAMNTFMT